MPVELVIPKLSMSMTEGVLTAWLKPNGASVAVGDLLYTVESEKTALDVESEIAGELVHAASEGATCEAGAVVGYVLAPGEAPPDNARASSEAAASELASENTAPAAANAIVGRLLATPIARRLARERGIDLSTVSGTGPGGRIQERDLPNTHGPAARASVMRREIAQRMHASLRDSAQFTIGVEVVMDAAHALRVELAREGVRVGYLDLVVAATARSLREHPRLNATMVADEVVESGGIDIGIAVALDEGLVVPVIHSADAISVTAVGEEISRLARAARTGQLSAAAFTGGTFTVSSLGAEGVTWFTPILNPPQVAVLGVGKVTEGAAWNDAVLVRRRKLALSLTIDHRAIDGVPAARFLGSVAERLARPRELLE